MPQFDDTRTTANIAKLHEREEEQLLQVLAPKYGIPYVNLFQTPIDTRALRILTEEVARDGKMAVFAQNEQTLSLAVGNPKDTQVQAITTLLAQRGFSVTIFLASTRGIAYAWEHYQKKEVAEAQHAGKLDVDPERIAEYFKTLTSHDDVARSITESMAVRDVRQTSTLISIIFGGALALGASDIHIEPEALAVRIRYRLDGVLRDVCDMNTPSATHIISRIKLLAGTKLNVKREAQDGRFTFDIGTREVEVRTSIIPGAYGESIVMRLLDPNASSFHIDTLGLTERLHEVVEAELKRPSGAILTTGPTGSGKTTALYSFLNAVHSPDVKIITLEDPVEYKLPGIVQTQITKEYSFELGLRTILRQDPDVILIGEIRDRVVAETAMHAALTGHLVLSTLHTNSAVGAIPRLVDLGVNHETIATACNLILGQRLVRKVCTACGIERELTVEEQKLIHRILEKPVAIHTVREGKGCPACNSTGYKGRIGVYEALQIDNRVKEVLLNRPSEKELREASLHQNIPSMQQDGILKVLAGITTLDEVSRVLDLYNT